MAVAGVADGINEWTDGVNGVSSRRCNRSLEQLIATQRAPLFGGVVKTNVTSRLVEN